MIDGGAPLEEVRQRLEIELGDAHADTVAGFILERLGRLATVGDVVRSEGVEFEVLSTDGRRIEQVRAAGEGRSAEG
jgi:putative hemolysin